MSNSLRDKSAKKILHLLTEKLEIVTKATGIVAALVAICALFLPSALWKPVESVIAMVYGTNGWVYYEVGKNRKITHDGNFYLLKETETGFYEEIKMGDKLRVAGDVNFRSGPGVEYPRSFVLITGDCVIITRPPKNKVDVENAESGGWLKVATSPCGLF